MPTFDPNALEGDNNPQQTSATQVVNVNPVQPAQQGNFVAGQDPVYQTPQVPVPPVPQMPEQFMPQQNVDPNQFQQNSFVDPAQQQIPNQNLYQNNQSTLQDQAMYQTPNEYQQTSAQYYDPGQVAQDMSNQTTEDEYTSGGIRKKPIIPFQKGIDIISLVDTIFRSAIDDGASDIHIEPYEEMLAIRFRIDGEFIEYQNFDHEYSESILTRIEVLAGLKIDKNRVPQDGKISYTHSDLRVDMRVSTFPTMYGNKVVIRLLVKDNKKKTLDMLGYDQYSQEIIKRNLDRTYGMVLMTGPTGSGKSTTLFAMLSSYDPFEQNISTLEDPIEYFIAGANQSQVNAEIGYDFPDGLRCLVRQDPDIIMVGEIRDGVTAKLAINAAITGHLVFSTLHANSASGTVQRLMNMDVDHFLVISALNLIVSQRLVRRICSHCKQPFQVDEKTLNLVQEELKDVPDAKGVPIQFFQGTGCEHCKNTGYKGRVAVYELLEMNHDISKVVIEKKGVAEEIQKVAVAGGMVTIKQNGLLAAIKGETTLEEVLIAVDAGL